LFVVTCVVMDDLPVFGVDGIDDVPPAHPPVMNGNEIKVEEDSHHGEEEVDDTDWFDEEEGVSDIVTQRSKTDVEGSSKQVQIEEKTSLGKLEGAMLEPGSDGSVELLVNNLRAEFLELQNENTNLKEKLQHHSDQARLLKEQVEKEKEEKSALKNQLDSLETTYKTQFNQMNESLAELKQSYFFVLAVSVKLQQSIAGEPCNIDVTALYDQAKKDQVDYNKWSQWIWKQVLGEKNRNKK